MCAIVGNPLHISGMNTCAKLDYSTLSQTIVTTLYVWIAAMVQCPLQSYDVASLVPKLPLS